MAPVNVTINGRQFRMACADGEEEHLIDLAADLDKRVENLRGQFGEVGDTRLTIMAALTVSDELVEARRRARALEEELLALREARMVASDRDRARESALAATLHRAAERVEDAARQLAQPAAEQVPLG
ncbi:MAG TPA: cell division protein ZapA [Xanthobacteraceae bacterium]|nr:cell division protein ZapA [Xanthobacteraceae bacterium]